MKNTGDNPFDKKVGGLLNAGKENEPEKSDKIEEKIEKKIEDKIDKPNKVEKPNVLNQIESLLGEKIEKEPGKNKTYYLSNKVINWVKQKAEASNKSESKVLDEIMQRIVDAYSEQ